MNTQRDRNTRARKIGAKITIAQGWDVEAKDGTVYSVTTAKELEQLLKQLEAMEKDNDNANR